MWCEWRLRGKALVRARGEGWMTEMRMGVEVGVGWGGWVLGWMFEPRGGRAQGVEAWKCPRGHPGESLQPATPPSLLPLQLCSEGHKGVGP